jgi:hypothetical protein
VPKLCRLGDVDFNVISDERPNISNEITERPVEDLGGVVDHINNLPLIFSIDGYVTSNAFQKLQELRRYAREKILLSYVGRNVITRVAIESLDTQHNSNIANGFAFTITLKQIRIAEIELVEIISPDPAIPRLPKKTETQVADISNKGTQVLEPRRVDIDAIRDSVKGKSIPPRPPNQIQDALDSIFPYAAIARRL